MRPPHRLLVVTPRREEGHALDEAPRATRSRVAPRLLLRARRERQRRRAAK
jgi:hypothetical protein